MQNVYVPELVELVLLRTDLSILHRDLKIYIFLLYYYNYINLYIQRRIQ